MPDFKFSDDQKEVVESVIGDSQKAEEFCTEIEQYIGYRKDAGNDELPHPAKTREKLNKVALQAEKLSNMISDLDPDSKTKLSKDYTIAGPIPEELLRLPQLDPEAEKIKDELKKCAQLLDIETASLKQQNITNSKRLDSLKEQYEAGFAKYELLHQRHLQQYDKTIEKLKGWGIWNTLESLEMLIKGAKGNDEPRGPGGPPNTSRLFLIYLVTIKFHASISESHPEFILRKLVEGSPLDKLIAMAISAAGWPAIFPNRFNYHDRVLKDYYLKSKAFWEANVTEEKTLDAKSLLSRPWK